MIRVGVIGEYLVDMISKDGIRFTANPGGAPANVAVGLARSLSRDDAIVGLISKVGDDPLGKFLRDRLSAEGVTSFLLEDPFHHTGLAIVTLKEGEPRFSLYSDVAYNHLTPSEIEEIWDQVGGFHLVHCGTLFMRRSPSREAQRRLLELAKGNRSLISLDLNLRLDLWREAEEELWRVVEELLEVADILKLSQEEYGLLAKHLELPEGDGLDSVGSLAERYSLKLIAITAGAEGSYLWSYSYPKVNFIPGFKVREVVDATGAGDAFMATLLGELVKRGLSLDNLSLEELTRIFKKSNLIGAIVVAREGAWSVPKPGELEEVARLRLADSLSGGDLGDLIK